MVEFSVLITSLYSPVGIAQQNLDTLLTTQRLLIGTLDAQFADIVAGLVIVVFLDIGRRSLSHIAQQMGCHVIGVLTDSTLLHVEAGEAEHLLLEHAEILIGQLTHEQLLRITRIARIAVAVLHRGHTTVELVTGDAEGMTELQRVKTVAHLVHHHHQVVRRLVEHQQLSLAVEHIATRGIFDFLQEGVRVGTLLIVVARDLKHEQTDDVDDHNQRSHPAYHVAPVCQIVVFHPFTFSVIHFLDLTLSMASISNSVSTVLHTARRIHNCQSKKLKASRIKNKRQ